MPSPWDILESIGSGASRLFQEADKPLSDRLGLRIPDDPLFFDEVGNFLLREATRPTNIGMAALGGAPAAALRGGGRVSRLAANVLEPVAQGGFATRLGGEAALSGIAGGAATAVGAATGNPLLAAGAGLLAGGGTAGITPKLLNSPSPMKQLQAPAVPSEPLPLTNINKPSTQSLIPEEGPYWDNLGRITGPLGSNPGGRYRGADGQDFYIKNYSDPGQAKAEVAAQDVYRAVGVEVPDGALRTVEGTPAVVNRWRSGLKEINPTEINSVVMADPALAARIHIASVATQNWDVVGNGWDNLVRTPEGGLMVVDTGGAFTYRAQGGYKPYTTDSAEFHTLLNPQVNKFSARAFEGLYDFPEARQSAIEAAEIIKANADRFAINLDDVSADDIRAKMDSVLRELGVDTNLAPKLSPTLSPIAQLEQGIRRDFDNYSAHAREMRKQEGADSVVRNLDPAYLDSLEKRPEIMDAARNVTGLEGKDGLERYLSMFQRELTDAWQEGYSGGSHSIYPLNIKSQHIAEEVFPDLVAGTSKPVIKDNVYEQGAFGGSDFNDLIKQLMKAEYKTTQESLATLGFKPTDTILLFRGLNSLDDVAWAELAKASPKRFMSGERGSRLMETMGMENVLQTEPGSTPGILGKMAFRGGEKLGPEVVFPLSSWTPDIKTASNFGDPTNPWDKSMMLVAEIPVSQILSIPQTGRGSLSESELVVLGAAKNGAGLLVDVPRGFEFPESDVFNAAFSTAKQGGNMTYGSNNRTRLNSVLENANYTFSPNIHDLARIGPWEYSDEAIKRGSTTSPASRLKAAGVSDSDINFAINKVLPTMSPENQELYLKSFEKNAAMKPYTSEANKAISPTFESAIMGADEMLTSDIGKKQLDDALDYYSKNQPWGDYMTQLTSMGLTPHEAAWFIDHNSITEIDAAILGELDG